MKVYPNTELYDGMRAFASCHASSWVVGTSCYNPRS
jgi:hypothetical protein